MHHGVGRSVKGCGILHIVAVELVFTRHEVVKAVPRQHVAHIAHRVCHRHAGVRGLRGQLQIGKGSACLRISRRFVLHRIRALVDIPFPDENGIVLTVEKQIKPEGAKRKVTVEEDQPYTYSEIKYTKYLIRFK